MSLTIYDLERRLDKTGTITLGNRKASAFIPVDGASEQELADAAQLSSLADETPEGRSVVILAKEKFNIRGRELSDKNMTSINRPYYSPTSWCTPASSMASYHLLADKSGMP